MKCDEIRAQLSLIRPDSSDADQGEFAPVLEHLQQCADCQAYWEIQQQTERELGRAIRNVSVPADFKARLMAQLTTAIAAPTATSVSPETVTTETSLPTTITQPLPRTRPADHAWTRRRAATVTSAALLLLAFGSWFFLNTPRQAQLSFSDLIALSESPAAGAAPAFQQSFEPVLPSDIWMPNGTRAASAKSVQHQGQEIGALFKYDALGRKSLRAVLMVINLERTTVSNLPAVGSSFVTAAVDYPLPKMYATRVWRVGQNLYVCYVRSGHADDLDRLQKHHQVS
ncbi:MAG: hypothetical protein JWN70_364 [Planctomycetaceae bacterium]|nr:hypothetical protein [Planctomycetaceae bacterium]